MKNPRNELYEEEEWCIGRIRKREDRTEDKSYERERRKAKEEILLNSPAEQTFHVSFRYARQYDPASSDTIGYLLIDAISNRQLFNVQPTFETKLAQTSIQRYDFFSRVPVIGYEYFRKSKLNQIKYFFANFTLLINKVSRYM